MNHKRLKIIILAGMVIILGYICFNLSKSKITLDIYIQQANIPNRDIRSLTICQNYDQYAKISTGMTYDFLIQLTDLAPKDITIDQVPENDIHCTSSTRTLIDMDKITEEELIERLMKHEIEYKIDDYEETIKISKDIIHFIE